MSTITGDPTLLLVLGQMKEVTEIRDASGNVVGVYTPTGMTDADARKLFDLDKARERLMREKDQGQPFKKILRKLRAMEAAEKRQAKRKKARRAG